MTRTSTTIKNPPIKRRLNEMGGEAAKGKNAWMLTFGDLLALLLAFFILLYSMSVVHEDDWQEVSGSLAKYLNPKDLSERTTSRVQLGIQSIYIETALDLDYLYTIMREKIEGDRVLQSSIQRLELTKQNIIISFSDATLFEDSRLTLSSDAQAALFGLGNTLQQVNNQMEVIGYADLGTSGNAQNVTTKLNNSLQKAIIVASELKKYGNNYKINAYGRASSRYEKSSEDAEAETTTTPLSSDRIDIIIKPEVGTRMQ